MTRLIRENPQVMERTRVARIGHERIAIMRLCLRELPLLVPADALSERSLRDGGPPGCRCAVLAGTTGF